MEKYEEYCRILGVQPGATADQVKRAFRVRIKRMHPDTARTEAEASQAQLLIEAYSAFKGGVPRQEQPRPRVTRPAAEEGVARRRQQSARRGESDVRRQGRETGQRIFDSIYKDRSEFLQDLYVNLNGEAFTEDDFDLFDAPDSGVRDHTDRFAELFKNRRRDFESRLEEHLGLRPDRKDAPKHPYDASMEYFARAEGVLRDTVARFDRRHNRFKASWIREYIAELVKVQVLFRDVSRRYPGLSSRSLERVRQINELISEIKRSRTGV